MMRRAARPDAVIRAEARRIGRILERDREVLGSRALSCQVAEYACGTDAGDLAELLEARMGGQQC